jgi:hypothetical protein
MTAAVARVYGFSRERPYSHSSAVAMTPGVVAPCPVLVVFGADLAAINAAIALDALADVNDADAIAARAFHPLDGYSHDSTPRLNVDIIFSVMWSSDVLDHVGQHLPNVTVGDAVEDLLALLVRLQQSSGAQQAQMMRHQGLFKSQSRGDLSDAERSREAVRHDAEAIGFAQQAEHLRKLRQFASVEHVLTYEHFFICHRS